MTEASTYQALRGHLAHLHLGAAAEALPGLLDQAKAEHWSATALLERLFALEVAAADARRHATLARLACLPAPWRISDFDFEAQPTVDKKGSPDLSVGRFIGSGTARVYWSRLVRDIAAIIQGVKLALCLCQALTTCWAYPDDNPQRSGGASAGVRGAGPRGPGCRCAQAAVRPGRSGQQPPRSSIAMAISASGSW